MLEQEVSRDSRERAEDSSILGRKAEGEALRKIISKLSEERNLRGPSSETLSHVCRTIQEENDSPGYSWTNYDLYQHVVKTCPFCNSVKPRCCRVSGHRAEEFGDLIFLDHQRTKSLDFSLLWIEPHHIGSHC